ncbi:MAG: DMT family transporter, partial [Ardenticatenaceae bacterium]
LTRGDFRSFAVLGLLMYVTFPVLFNSALKYTTASRGAVILATMPLWTALLARRYVSESLRVGQMVGVLVSITGVAVVIAESGFGELGGRDALLGNSLMVIAAIVAAIYGVRIKSVLARRDALQVTAFAMAIGAAALLIPAMIEGLPNQLADASLNTLLLVLYLGVAGGAIAFWLFSVALAHLSPTQAIVYVNLNPVVATLLASIFLDEPLTISFAIGFALVVAGLLLTNLPTRRLSIRQ